MIDIAIELVGDGLERFNRCAQVGIARAYLLERGDSMAECRELLAELIVHLACDPPPLIFLREDEPCEQVGARPLGALPFGDLIAQRRVRLRQLGGAILNPEFQLVARPSQALLRQLALGEIEMRPDDSHHRAIGLSPDRKSAGEHVNVAPILVPKAKLGFVLPLAARDAIVRLVGPRSILRVDQALPRADVRLDLVVRVAEHLFPSRRIHDIVRFEVPVPDAFLRAGERECQALFAFEQGGVGALPFGDIEVSADDANDRAIGLEADRKSARQHVDVMPQFVAKPKLALVSRAAACEPVIQLPRPWLVVGMQQPFPRVDVRLDLLVRVAEHFLPARRIHNRARLNIPVVHAFPSAGERERQSFFALAENCFGAFSR